MKRLLPAFLLVLALLALAYLLLPRGHTFYGTRLLNPKPVDFALEGPQGPVRLSQFQDKVVLLFFGFTRCPDVCPTTLLALKRAYEKLPPKAQERVQVIFVSVDPERDPRRSPTATPRPSTRASSGFREARRRFGRRPRPSGSSTRRASTGARGSTWWTTPPPPSW